jgi:hypothetical protein
MVYKVTLELKTPWYIKALRFLSLKKKRVEFDLILSGDHYKAGDILTSIATEVLIIDKQDYGKNF